MDALDKIPDKDSRRLKHLFSIVCPPVMFPRLDLAGRDKNFLTKEEIRRDLLDESDKQFNSMKEHVLNKDIKYQFPGMKQKLELFNLIQRYDIKFHEIHLVWRKLWVEQRKRSDEYKRKPKPESRDNKDVLVGSGGSNRNKIRYPKKARKTAWKRFYKLFPNLDPKNKKEE